MADTIICTEIRKIHGGFLVKRPWPHGDEVTGYGEVICNNFNEVIALLRKRALLKRRKNQGEKIKEPKKLEECPICGAKTVGGVNRTGVDGRIVWFRIYECAGKASCEDLGWGCFKIMITNCLAEEKEEKDGKEESTPT